LTAGLLAAFRYRRSGRAGALIGMAASLVLGVLTRPVEGSFLLPALLLLVGTPPTPEGTERPWIAAAYLLALAITGFVNWGRTGSPLETGYGGGWTTSLWIGVPGLLLSPG